MEGTAHNPHTFLPRRSSDLGGVFPRWEVERGFPQNLGFEKFLFNLNPPLPRWKRCRFQTDNPLTELLRDGFDSESNVD